MPPRQSLYDEFWSLLDCIWYWLVLALVWLGVHMFFENYWADICAGVTLIFIGWLVYKTKNWLYPREKLCNITFNNWSNRSKKYIGEGILKRPPRPTQTVSIYLDCKNGKEIQDIRIRIGQQVHLVRRLWRIVANRMRDHRYLDGFSPHTIPILRVPLVESDSSQPIIQEVSAYVSDKQVSIEHEITSSECIIIFDPPVTIPAYVGGGQPLEIRLKIKTEHEWAGVMICTSRVKVRDEDSVARIRVSSKYEVQDERYNL